MAVDHFVRVVRSLTIDVVGIVMMDDGFVMVAMYLTKLGVIFARAVDGITTTVAGFMMG